MLCLEDPSDIVISGSAESAAGKSFAVMIERCVGKTIDGLDCLEGAEWEKKFAQVSFYSQT